MQQTKQKAEHDAVEATAAVEREVLARSDDLHHMYEQHHAGDIAQVGAEPERQVRYQIGYGQRVEGEYIQFQKVIHVPPM